MTFTPEELKELARLISWSVNGCEHGVISYDQWRAKCKELADFMRARGMAPFGQWAT